MKTYTVKKSFCAPNMNSQKGAKLMFKDFLAGTTVAGVLYKAPNLPLKFTPSIIIDGAFIIPLANLEEIEEMKSNTDGQAQEPETTTLPPVQVCADVTIVTLEPVSHKGLLVGLAIGTAAGILTALILKKSVLLYGAIGLATGGITGHLISKKN